MQSHSLRLCLQRTKANMTTCRAVQELYSLLHRPEHPSRHKRMLRSHAFHSHEKAPQHCVHEESLPEGTPGFSELTRKSVNMNLYLLVEILDASFNYVLDRDYIHISPYDKYQDYFPLCSQTSQGVTSSNKVPWRPNSGFFQLNQKTTAIPGSKQHCIQLSAC